MTREDANYIRELLKRIERLEEEKEQLKRVYDAKALELFTRNTNERLNIPGSCYTEVFKVIDVYYCTELTRLYRLLEEYGGEK